MAQRKYPSAKKATNLKGAARPERSREPAENRLEFARRIADALDRLKSLLLLHGQNVEGEYPFLPRLHNVAGDFRLRRRNATPSDQGKANVLPLQAELERRCATAKMSLLRHAADGHLVDACVRLKRTALNAFVRTNITVSRNCIRLGLESGRSQDVTDLLRKTIRKTCPQDLPEWFPHTSGPVVVPWTYLTDLEAVIDEWDPYADPFTVNPPVPQGYFFEFLPSTVRYRGRELRLRNGLAKDTLIQLAFRFNEFLDQKELPLNDELPMATASPRQAIARIRKAMRDAAIPCEIHHSRAHGYKLQRAPN